MKGRPDLLSDVEVIADTEGALGDGRVADMPPLQDIKDATQRIADEAQKQNPSCEETEEITDINDRVQQGHVSREDMEIAATIGSRAAAGAIGVPPRPKRPRI